MAKGEDALIRKKNKKLRKKNSSGSSSVSAKVAAVIAAKKRRKAGKRRMCQVQNLSSLLFFLQNVFFLVNFSFWWFSFVFLFDLLCFTFVLFSLQNVS